MLLERFRQTLGRALVGIDPHTAAKGEQVYAAGRVLDVREPAPGQLEGEVEGSHGETYLATVRLSANGAVSRASSRCTCPVGFECKHGAALLLAWLGEPVPGAGMPASRAPRPSDPRPAPPGSGVPVDGADGAPRTGGPRGPVAADAFDAMGRLRALDWVRSLRAVRPADAGATSALAWVLAPPAAGRPVHLSVWRRRGDDLRPYPTLRDHVFQPPAWWAPVDAFAAAMLLRAPAAGGHAFVLDATESADLLMRLAAAGRLHLGSPPGAPGSRPLAVGAARPARLAWLPATAQADAPLRLGWAVSPEADVLALPRPCWLDREAGTIGPLATELPELLLEWLHGAPPVPADAVDDVTLALHTQLRDRPQWREQVPSPSPRPVRERTGVPRPVLVLALETARPRGGAAPGRALTVACAMQYEDRRLEPLRAGSLGVRDGEGLVLVLCDHEAERARLAELRAALLPALDGAAGAELLPGPDDAPPRPRATPAIGSLAVARLPATGLAAARIVLEVAPALADAGWTIVDDARLPVRLLDGDALSVGLSAVTPPGRAGSDGPVEPAAARWFDLQVGMRVGDRRIDLAPVLAQIVERGGYEAWLSSCGAGAAVWLQVSEGEVLRIEAARIEPLARLVTDWAERAPPGEEGDGALRVDAFTAAQLALLVPDATVPASLAALAALRERASSFDRLPAVDPPATLLAELRPYQRDGLAWLQFVARCGLGGVLADDMGLGKTVQVLAHLACERAAGRMDAPVLVVAPTSLVFNWQDEAARHVPSLRVLALTGADRSHRFDAIGAHDLVITSYALLPRDAERLQAVEWHAVVADEAHRVKNPRTQAAVALRALRAGHRLALSGTPLENHLGELWSVMQFAVPGLLGSDASFRARFRAPIERRPGGIEAAERLQALERRVRPFLLRRTKAAVLRELPALTEIVHRVELGREQRDLYESLRAAMDERVRQALARSGLARGRIVVLDALLKLRQACCDPGLLALPAARRVTRSAKREALLELLHPLVDEGRKVLVFSQFTTMLDRIETAIDGDARLRTVPRARLDGDTDDRRGAVDAFQQGEAQLFLLSLKAGGVGLNLTAADTVIHYDPWWNPAVQSQATDRAHRIGQDKPVFVYALVCAGTIEERILQLQSTKRELAAAVLAGGQAAGALTQDDLIALFSEG